jgi:hypothetical protein
MRNVRTIAYSLLVLLPLLTGRICLVAQNQADPPSPQGTVASDRSSFTAPTTIRQYESAKTIAEISNRGSVSEDRAQFGHL